MDGGSAQTFNSTSAQLSQTARIRCGSSVSKASSLKRATSDWSTRERRKAWRTALTTA